MRHTHRSIGTVKRAAALCAAAAMFSGVAVDAWAQTQVSMDSRALTGSVQDSRGLPLLGAFVAVIALGADQPAAIVVTDAQGRFSVPSLNDGVYSLLVGSLGFAGTIVQGIQVPTALPVSLQLEPNSGRELSAFDAPLDMSFAVRSSRRDVLRETDATLVADDSAPENARGGDRALARADRPAGLAGPVAGEFRLWSFARVGERETVGVTSVSVGDTSAWNLKAHLGDRGSVWASSGLTRDLGGGHTLNVGFGYVGGNFGAFQVGSSRQEQQRDTWIGRMQAEDRWQILEPLSVRYSVRYEHHNYLVRESLLSPSVEVAYEPIENTELVAGVSYDSEGLDLASENAGFDVMSMLGHSNLRIGDTGDLRPQRSLRYHFGVQQQIGDAEVRVRAYYDDMTDELLGVFVSGSRGVNNYLLFSLGDAEARGFELGVAAKLIDSVSGAVTYQYRDRDVEYPLPATDPIAAQNETLADWGLRSTHEVEATVAAEFEPSRTHLTAIYNWRGGMPVVRDGNLTNHYGRFDLRVRQMLPFRTLDSEWSALVQVRNILGPHYDGLYDVSLSELVGLTRGIAGGLAVRF